MSKHTPAQVGHVADVSAHASTALPPGVDTTRDDDAQPANYSPRESRSWRGVTYGQPAPGPATDGRMGSLPEAHRDGGSANPRGVWGGQAGTTGPTHESLRPAAEVLDNSRAEVTLRDQAAPERPRAGSTGADPARRSFMPRWLFFRPFDAWAQYGPAALDKIEQASPVASRPLSFSAPLADPEPFGGGSGATVMGGWEDTPNTVRLLPQPWDTTTTTATSDMGTGREAAARARGWGLR